MEERIEVQKASPTPSKPAKSSHKAKSSEKKESAGFSLFSFMNSSKQKESDGKKFVENTTKSIVEKIVIEQPEIHEEKSHEAEKKRREFFGATIFDEEESNQNSSKIDDDILNVPAFFRRKK